MTSRKQTHRVELYFLSGIALCLLMVALKALAAWITETYVYTLPLIGGVLTSLEIAEMANLVIFVILGVGLGALTLYLPTNWTLVPKLTLLMASLPLILSTGYIVRHSLWVRQVADRAGLSPDQAQAATNDFLERETGRGGNWGFYQYTARVSQPPTQLTNLQALSSEEMATLQGQLSQYSGSSSNLFTFIFNRVGWGVRLIYLLLSGFLGLFYFFKGKLWADRQR
jgi:hypothetical protein